MRARVVERRNRLGSPAIDDLADPVVDLVERRMPRDLLKLSRALCPDTAQRVQQALRPVHKGRHIACDFGTDDPGGVRHRVGAAHFRDAALVDRDGQTAGIGAVEGANAGVFFERHRRAPCRNGDDQLSICLVWRLQLNIAHLPIALAISGAAEIGTSKTAAAGSAEHDAVAAANKLWAAVIDGLAVDRHKAEPTGGAAAKSRGGDLGALDDKQRGDIVIAFDIYRDMLAAPPTILSVAARAFAQPLVAEEDRVVALGNLDRCRRDVGWP